MRVTLAANHQTKAMRLLQPTPAPTESDTMNEIIACPKCGQPTASQFFRAVGKKPLCVLCAQRAEEADKALADATEDYKLHGGLGWLWKHIAWVIACFIGYLFLRGIIGSLIRSLFGGH